jgi:hypothetical protein
MQVLIDKFLAVLKMYLFDFFAFLGANKVGEGDVTIDSFVFVSHEMNEHKTGCSIDENYVVFIAL